MTDVQGFEFWQAAVFCSATATGNPTGIVFPGSFPAEGVCQAAAALLGLPDTVFLCPAEGPFWSARTFSPAEPISFCIQTLLASHAVLRARSGHAPPSHQIRVGERLLRVWSGPPSSRVAWVEIPPADIRVLDQRPPLAHLLGERPALTIDAGRRRVYCRMSREELNALRLDSEEVLRLCRTHGLHGICAFAMKAAQECELRVFTTSLDGREDSATGGAVSGLFTYLDSTEPGGYRFDEVWTVHQGHGPSHRRGTLFAKRSQEGAIHIGGEVALLVRGALLDTAGLQ